MTESSAVAAVRSRLNEVQSELGSLEAEFEKAKKALDERRKPLQDERAGLRKSLEILGKTLGTSTNGNSASAASASTTVDDDEVTYDSIIAAVREIGAASKTPVIAEHMNVGPRKIARKLKKLADEGKIAGDKDSGYRALA